MNQNTLIVIDILTSAPVGEQAIAIVTHHRKAEKETVLAQPFDPTVLVLTHHTKPASGEVR